MAKRSATSRSAISSSRVYPSPSSTSSAIRSAKARQPLSIEHAVTPRDKHKRSQRLARLSEEHLQDFYRANLGRELTVIWEHGNYDGRMMGHSENYIRVAQPYDEAAIGTTTRITPQHLDESGTFVY